MENKILTWEQFCNEISLDCLRRCDIRLRPENWLHFGGKTDVHVNFDKDVRIEKHDFFFRLTDKKVEMSIFKDGSGLTLQVF